MRNLLIIKFVLFVTFVFSKTGLTSEGDVMNESKLRIEKLGQFHLLGSNGDAVDGHRFGVLQNQKDCYRAFYLRLTSYKRDVEIPNGLYKVQLIGNKTNKQIEVVKKFKSNKLALMKLYTFAVTWSDDIQKFFETNDKVTVKLSNEVTEKYLDLPQEEFSFPGFYQMYSHLKRKCSSSN